MNISSLKENGLDIEASYEMPLSNVDEAWGGDLTFRFLGTQVYEYRSVLLGNVTESAGDNVATVGGGAPHFRAYASATYNTDAFTGMLAMRYISAGRINDQFIQCNSGCPLATANNPTYNYDSIVANTLFDVALAYRPLRDTNSLEVYLNIDNVTNAESAKHPWLYRR